jgi:hypothetical protein
MIHHSICVHIQLTFELMIGFVKSDLILSIKNFKIIMIKFNTKTRTDPIFFLLLLFIGRKKVHFNPCISYPLHFPFFLFGFSILNFIFFTFQSLKFKKKEKVTKKKMLDERECCWLDKIVGFFLRNSLDKMSVIEVFLNLISLKK